ncbi:hypothetical protein BH23VER1_BH23VER1_21990 [soil metagenome]
MKIPYVGFTTVAALLGAPLDVSGAPEPIGFVETFVLAPDAAAREAALAELVPGTEEYYYFHALHYQHTDQAENLDGLLESWQERNAGSALLKSIRHRRALLGYDDDPAATIAYLRRELNLHFNHSKAVPERERQLPNALDPDTVSADAFNEEAAPGQDGYLQNLTASGIAWLLREGDPAALTQTIRRQLLQRIPHPGFEVLTDLLVTELKSNDTPEFASFEIHRNLTLAQLDTLREAVPGLARDQAFVLTYLGKLRPGADTDPVRDREARASFLARAWEFVAPLDPAFNSLKAHILYHWLDLDRRNGTYDRERFLAYLRLPRPVPYISPDFRSSDPVWNHPADLGTDYSGTTGLPPIGGEEPLVRDYLLHFLTGAQTIAPFDRFVRDTYLKPLLAEANIVSGNGDPESHANLLSPSAFADLRERIDLDFALTNPDEFSPGNEIALDVFIKNVPDLLVKVYEINARNVYLDQGREVGTDLDLDGLVPNAETAHHYDASPFLRDRHTFTFPALDDRRGIWIIEFVGNGTSSRALVRKGTLTPLERISAAGQAITVIDETRTVRQDATATLGGKTFSADENGEIFIPFSTDPGTKDLVLTDGSGFSALTKLEHRAESVALDAAFHVERESLLPGRLASVAFRPTVTIAGEQVSVGVLEDPVLSITATDLQGTSTTADYEDLALTDHAATLQEFRIPDRIRSLTFAFKATVTRVSDGEEQQVSDSRSFGINAIDATAATRDLHLSKTGDGYVLSLLGKSGEPVPDRAVTVTVRRPEFTHTLRHTLKTDAAGRVALGPLGGITSIEASGPGGIERTFPLLEDRAVLPDTINALAGRPVFVPLPSPDLDAADLILFETVYDTVIRDRSDALSVEDGFVKLADLPAGDYRLGLPDDPHAVRIRITDGNAVGRHLVSDTRILEASDPTPLQITGIDADAETVTIRLTNSTATTRIHVAATAFAPPPILDLFRDLAPDARAPGGLVPAYRPNRYLSGRDIGDEARYILDRRSAPKFAGSLLPRPGLLLNPWELRTTETELQDAMAGEDLQRIEDGVDAAGMEEGRAERKLGRAREQHEIPTDPHSLDFLSTQGFVAYNLRPDEDGTLTIPLAGLGDRRHLHAVAIDSNAAVYRETVLPGDGEIPRRDLRLAASLDPALHYARSNTSSVIPVGDSLTLPDTRSAQLQTYSTLADAFALLQSLSGSPDLATFSFLPRWASLTEAEKRDRYSEHASHELSFFIAQKDPEFLQSVVLPYLANKRDKTFLDRYLLGDDLTRFLDQWRFAQLNTVERILLGRQIAEQRESVARLLSDQLAILLPPAPVGGTDHFFRYAILGRGLDSTNEFASYLGQVIMEKRAEGDALDAVTAAPSMPAAPAPAEAGDAFMAAPEQEEILREELIVDLSDGDRDLTVAFSRSDLARRKLAEVSRLYLAAEKTKEWAENNYYHLPIAEQDADLIPPSEFWLEFAEHDPAQPFLSPRFPQASRNLAETLLALAILDLPFENANPAPEIADDGTLTVSATESPFIAYYRHLEETPVAEGDAAQPLLASQSFYRQDDATEIRDGQQILKPAGDEFLTGVVYGSKLVLSNPSPAPRELSVVTQIPAGSVPVSATEYTGTHAVSLAPYAVQTLDYFFYFPDPGQFAGYPAQIAEGESIVAFTEPATFTVVTDLADTDQTSWPYLSQDGSDADVLEYLESGNLLAIDLSQIAWRVRENADFFDQVVAVLSRRHVFDPTLYSYGIAHDRPEAIAHYLLYQEGFLNQAGPAVQSPLVVADPVERRRYQHLEYRPLINARTHQLGRQRTIPNDALHAQYHALLGILATMPELDAEDHLALAYYLLLQDRISESIAQFAASDPAATPESLQRDYLGAILALHQEEIHTAAQLAAAHADHPVPRWRTLFADVLRHVAAIRGPGRLQDPDDAASQQALADAEPGLDFTITGDTVELTYQNLDSVTANYYAMDLEFLFSSAPFLDGDTDRFNVISPNQTEVVALDPDRGTHEFKLPRGFQNQNVLVELVARGSARKAVPHFANQIDVSLAESYGRLTVRHSADARPLPKAYVKVFARTADGGTQFYKDGYTDLTGRFDYASLTRGTAELDATTRFALLVLTEDNGATVIQAKPPTR